MKTLLNSLDEQFLSLHRRSRSIVEKIPPGKIYWQPPALETSFAAFSCGEFVLRGAGAVEQAFGGITAKLWDDPFEWTLPEELATSAKILDYLAEVEATRQKGFAFFASDADLLREIPAPEIMQTIFEILLGTIARAAHFQGRAAAVLQLLTGEKIAHL